MTNRELSTVPAASDVVEVSTSFGSFRVDRRDAVEFPAGVPGFEQCRRFVVLASDEIAPLRCLHSVDGPPASFLVVDPREVLAQYRAVLSQTDLFRLGATDGTPLLWLAVVGFDDGGEPYANLRAPIVINPERMLGYQVMPHNSLYPLRHALTSE
jgi:flagellar assembly factor FliW